MDEVTSVTDGSRQQRWWLGYGIVVGILVLGCFTPSVEGEPLPPQQEEELECLLVGAWDHQTRDRTRIQPDAQNEYHFDADGTGYFEGTDEAPMDLDLPAETIDFEWRLEGRNLFVDRDDGQEDVFRVDEWSETQMDWYNYNTTEDFGMGRHDEESVPDC